MKQKKMNLMDKIGLIESVVMVADFWGVKPADLLSFVAIIKEKKVAEWNKIAEEVEAFKKASVEERAKMLGIRLTMK